MAKKYISIDADEFEHLLNCMCSQKFLQELLPKDRKKNQKVIDEAYHAARAMLDGKIRSNIRVLKT